MFQALLFLLPILHSHATLVKNPPIQVVMLPNKTDSLAISTQDYKHILLEGADNVRLYKLDGKSYSQNLIDFEETQANQMANKGCSFAQRRINFEGSNQASLPDTQTYIYTDIIAMNNSVYLLRNDFKIFNVLISQAQIRVSAEVFDFSELWKPLEKMQMFGLDDNVLYIVSNGGAIRYNGTKATFEKLIKVEDFKNIHYCWKIKTLFIVGSTILVYQVEEAGLKLKYEMRFPFTVVQVHNNKNEVFLLDSKVGIHFVTLEPTEYKLQDFQIPLSNALSFIYDRNSFVVVAQTDQEVSFAVEILIDFKKKEYFYNRFSLEDMQFLDIQKAGDFKYIRGFDVHKIVQTNVVSQIDEEGSDPESYFLMPLLEKAIVIPKDEEANTTNTKQITILCLTPHVVQEFVLKESLPEVVCQSNEPVEQTYLVQMNTTQCSESEASPLVVCQRMHRILLNVEGVVLDSRGALKAEIFLITVLVIFAVLLTVGVCMCRRWRLVQNAMQRELQKQEKKKYKSLQQLE